MIDHYRRRASSAVTAPRWGALSWSWHFCRERSLHPPTLAPHPCARPPRSPSSSRSSRAVSAPPRPAARPPRCPPSRATRRPSTARCPPPRGATSRASRWRASRAPSRSWCRAAMRRTRRCSCCSTAPTPTARASSRRRARVAARLDGPAPAPPPRRARRALRGPRGLPGAARPRDGLTRRSRAAARRASVAVLMAALETPFLGPSRWARPRFESRSLPAAAERS
jgi:hypothetical protein